MSTLRSKIDRGRRTKKKSPPFEETSDDNKDEGEEKIHVEEKEESEHGDPEEEDDASEEDEVAKPRKQAPPKKKASPKKKQEEDAVEYADDPSSEESELEPEQKDDEDYQEPSEESDNDGDDDDESFDEDDDEEYGKKSKKRKAAPVRKKKGRPAAKKKETKRAPAKQSRSSARARKPTRYASDDDTDENEDDDEEYDEKPAARRKSSSSRRDCNSSEGRRASPRGRKKTITSYKVVGSSDEEDNDSEHDDSYSRTPVRRARHASAKALANIHQLRYRQDREAEDEEDDDDDVPIASLSAKKSSSARKRKKIDSDDEEFQITEVAQEKDEDDELDDDADFSGEDAPTQNKTVGNVEDADFCEDEQSEDESVVKTPERHAAKPNASVSAPDGSPHQCDSDDEVEIEPTPTKAKLSQEERTQSRKTNGKSTPPRMPNCPSTHDEITADPLPRIHVCCLAPDGQSRQCFALETLHKIATMSAHPAYRKDHLSDKQHQTFLQPPAFRTPMSEDICDQIAARFGRQALDLNGHFYRRDKMASATKNASSDEEEDEEDNGYLINFTRAHTDTDGFIENWKDYQLRSMQGDIYACPICYTAAHHRLKSSKKEIHIPQEFSYDPMTVLGSPDNEDFDIAAAFCFRKISQVKQHLRDDHGCKTAKIDSQLFMRYKVRTQDGLLQRFLANDHTYGKTKQGDMRRYWYDGNSELFIYLLYKMAQLQHYRDSLGQSNSDDSSDGDEGNLLADAKNFFISFQEQAQRLWDGIVAPFDRSKTQDMSDFLVDGVEDEEDEAPHHMFVNEHAETSRSDDEAKVARYKMLAEEHDSSDESSDDVQYPQESFEESESEDEWVTNIRSKKRRLSKADGTSTPKNGKRRLSKIDGKTSSGESDSDAAIEDIGSKKATPASVSKRAIFEDSDSD